MKLSDKIKQLRNSANLTQPELAQAAGIEQSYLSKLENDKGSPSFEVISKLAAALNTDAMAIIEALDAIYVKENLAHIPEIAAKATEIRIAKKQKEKSGFIKAAVMIVFGLAFVLLGSAKTVFSEYTYEYYSKGVLKKGESLHQFSKGLNFDIDKSAKQYEQRRINNKSRIDERLILINEYKGQEFIENIPEGRRIYRLENKTDSTHHYNDFIVVLGMVLLISGGFMMSYVYKYKD
ncbi:MAG: hypothetical protein COB35_06315 [Gammaproteobacteria bacterium]|nr:MAG: hypothetical protein COB35_06315 [Gammaproteobacteria bacterium]